ncbi:gp58-like family protein [Lactobacillus johnsonii]|uniref:gp58-like family protein n=1 Tax=Lactobacillus johnsonii TaxID=33959 RepID=UPI0028FC2616|nr:gp58-like family protein [Lactobacillus johnsonii]WNW29467.1 gp58-like family protein [Lactobacillus johnsonii]
MLKQIKEAQDAWRATQRTLDIKVVINGKTYNATDINSLKYDSGAYTGDTFSIGSTYSNNVQIEFSHLVEGLKLGMEVHPSIGIKTSKGYIYEPLGVFIISSEIKMDRNNNLTSISASDRFCGLEGTYKSKLAYPARVLDVIAEICAQSGVKANVDDLARLPHQADLPHPITGQTYRKALGWIAQLYAGYATFDRHGLFTIRTIAEPNYELDPSQYEQAGLTKNEAPYKISGIQCQTTITTKTRDGEDTDETKTYQVGDTNGSQIKLENNIMTPDRLTNIWEQLKDVTFYPFSLNWFGNPAIEAGDWLKLQDKQGNKFIVPNNSYTLDFNGGLSATSKADQTSSTDSGIAWEGTFSQTIRELQGRKAPDGTVIFPPSVTEPPTNAKPNDVWFKQNGNSTELWVFTEQEDGTGKWIRRDLTPDEIKRQVQEAQDGLKDAKKEIADNLVKADSDIAELNASIAGQNSKIDGLNTSVNTVVIPKVTDITNQVSDVVTKVNEQKNIVTGLQNQATQQGKDISKITTDVHGVTVDLANLNGDVNQTKATVQGLQTTLGNAQGDIAQIKVDAKKLFASLSGKVDNSTYANFVSATNNALNTKLVASDLNGYAKTTDVQATANGLQVNINSVSGKLDNLVIGNRNLVRNSGFPINTDYWNGPEIANHAFYYSDTKPLFLLKNNSSEKNYAESAYFPLKRNTTYVASFKGFSSVNVSSCDVFILARKYGENNKYTTVEHVVDAKRLSPSKVEYIKDLIFNSGENDEAYIRFDNNGSTNNEFGLLFFTEVKIEEGNKSTAWTPDPEDEQDRINGITSQLSARITANSQQFSSYYSKTDIDHKVSGVQSQITQNATGLQTVVAKVDNIRIGGTNLIRDSAMRADSHTAWQESGTVTWHVNSVEVSKGDLIQNIPAKPNTTYTFSFDLYYQDFRNAWANQFFFVEYTDTNFNKTTPKYVDHRWAGNQFPNTAGRKDKKLTFTTQGDCNGLKMYIRQEANQNPFHIFKLKLEEGNQATDWSPAPEDKANQSDYSALNQTVKGIQSTVSSNYGNLQSQISQTAGNIRNEVTDKISGVQSQITQNVNNLNLRLNNVSRNLVLNSGNFQDLHGWYTNTNGALTLGKHGFWKNSSENVLWINNPSKTDEVTVSSARFDVVPHTTYTISFYAFASANVTSSDLYFLGRKKSSKNDFDYIINPISLRRYSPSQAEYITATINTGDSEEGYIRFDNNGSTDGNGNLLGITDIQMEEGSVATPWKPAASDQVLAQINVAAGTTLIQNDKIYMDASSTVFSGKAFIPDAAITNVSADKINTGTLDAGRINVINLNANNITTGTINGANLKIDLNSGEILFQKGRIGSTNGYLNIDIDSGKMSVTNSTNSGVFFENGELYLSDNWAYGTNSQPKYGVIRRSIHSFTLGECGAEIASPSGISLQTMNYDGAFGAAGFLDQTKNGASVAIDRNGQALINAKQVGLTGGTFFSDNKFIPSKRRPRIVVGTDADASGLNLWGWGDPLNHVASRIVIDASYVHFPNSYNTTTGSAPNLYIASDGAIVRSTSASKYKTDIKRSYSTEYGEKLLNLPTAIWTDKGQKERYEAGKRHIKPEKYFGMIAEDLADAGLDLLVSRNPQTHEIEGIQYERIAPALLPVIKELKDKVNKLEKKVNE